MSRTIDIAVFGATGFTGLRVAKYLVSISTPGSQLKWAMCGRSQTKLQQAQQAIGAEGATLLVADVGDEKSLDRMCSQARVVINCVGPFRFFGEQVVASAVRCECNYVDVTGEPAFIERMMLKYSSQAADNKVLIVPCCGFDSIPADMGVLFNASQFQWPAQISSVESFLSLKAAPGYTGHSATWESAVEGFGDADTLRQNRVELRKVQPRVPIVGAKIRVRGKPYREPRVGNRFALPFPGADVSVVRNSQALLVGRGLARPASTKPTPLQVSLPQYAAYFTVGSYVYVLVCALMATVMGWLAKYKTGRDWLKRFPRFFSFGTFSHQGPNEVQIATSSFQMDFFGSGYRNAEQLDEKSVTDKFVHTRVSGPEPGYAATPIIVVQAALTILTDKPSLPCGVLTPAAAFVGSNLIERLSSAGVRFDVIRS